MSNKTDRLTIRLKPEELASIETTAKRFGYSSSEYVRFCVMDQIQHRSIPLPEAAKLMHRLLCDKNVRKNEVLMHDLKEVSRKWHL